MNNTLFNSRKGFGTLACHNEIANLVNKYSKQDERGEQDKHQQIIINADESDFRLRQFQGRKR